MKTLLIVALMFKSVGGFFAFADQFEQNKNMTKAIKIRIERDSIQYRQRVTEDSLKLLALQTEFVDYQIHLLDSLDKDMKQRNVQSAKIIHWLNWASARLKCETR